MPSIFTIGASWGIRITAGAPCAAAAQATPWAWLPEEKASTPRASASGASAETAAQAPRALKEPVTCRHSALTQTRRPARLSSAAAESSGVRCTWPRPRAAAARIR